MRRRGRAGARARFLAHSAAIDARNLAGATMLQAAAENGVSGRLFIIEMIVGYAILNP